MSVATKETLEFRSELRQMLDLITHSLYSHEEVFLRELISNAADAIDRLRFRSLTDGALLGDDREYAIRLVADKDARTLTVSDNGVGLTRDEAVENLGTIARSGTKAFLESLAEVDAKSRPELIGQFGVGFYSAFMVADTVTVVSKAAGPGHEAVRWTSDGKGSFTVEPADRTTRGTDVVLHLKEDKTEFPRDLEAPPAREAVLGLRRASRRHAGRRQGRDAELAEGRLAAAEGRGDEGRVRGLLPPGVARHGRAGEGPPLHGRGDDRVQGPPLHSRGEAVRPPLGRGEGGAAALREARPRHGPLRGAPPAVPSLREGGRRLRRPPAQRLARAPPAEPAPFGHPEEPREERPEGRSPS